MASSASTRRPRVALFSTGDAQTLDKAKLDQFFDRLAEKNKAMGSLTIAKAGNVLYTRAIGFSEINGTEMKPLSTASRFRIGGESEQFVVEKAEDAMMIPLNRKPVGV